MNDPLMRAALEEWNRVTSQLAFPDYGPSASAELRAAVAEHNQQIAEVTKLVRSVNEAINNAIANAESGDFGDLFVTMDVSRVDRADLLQKLAAGWKRRHELAIMARDEFATLRPPAQQAYDKTLEQVKKDLTKIGQGIEATLAFHHNGAAAERQFDALAKANLRTRKAQLELDQAVALEQAAADQVGPSLRGREAAAKFLAKEARKLAAL